jgi:hypothetical protein
LDSLLCLGLKLDIQFGRTSFKCRKWEYWMQLYIKARSRSDHWIWSLRFFCKALCLLILYPWVVVLSIHPSRHPSIQVPHPGRRRWWGTSQCRKVRGTH